MPIDNQYNHSAFADVVDRWTLLNAWAQTHYTEAAWISRDKFDKQIRLLKSLTPHLPDRRTPATGTDISNHWISKQILHTLRRQRRQLSERAHVLNEMLELCAEHAQTSRAGYHYKNMHAFSGELCRLATQAMALESQLAARLVAMGVEEAADYLPGSNRTLH